MDLHRDGNLIEAIVWFVLAVVLLLHSLRAPKHTRPTLHILASAIVVFGVSDLVEMRTGAWWRPWWLFVWKAACVVVLFFGFLRYHRLTKRGANKERQPAPPET
jgi:hypothetical protein